MRELRTHLNCLLLSALLVFGEFPIARADWNVANPPGPRTAIAVDTDEGTWLNLDLSSNGQTVAFDFLGHIYIMGIKGGDAHAITQGLSFDSQPRFSPDGTRIAFVSDRSGADNIWIMDRNGENMRQLTNESVHLPSAPSWSPDGRFLLVRKHYTALRTIGAGEVWMIPVDVGGIGVRLVERQSTQKDVNEPAFSRDGRTVYFSRESWPGDDFEYNKDVHKGIYQILALDLLHGGTKTVVAGPGGGVRPTPSPDGRWLAYVKRIGISAEGLSSALIVRDVESSVERIVYDRLDQDAQEVWANYGLYPAFAWTPDSSALVFWAGGKIRRADLKGGQPQIIPFHIRQTYEVVQPPRPTFEAAPPRFPVRMLRWVTVSPQGNRVAYQALGAIYVRDLPSGTPRRLTKQHEDFEIFPSFSPDGEWIVYSTWNDRTLGSVRRTNVRTGKTETLTRHPGHYLEPAASPDGHWVLFRRPEATPPAHRLLSATWGGDPGIYEVPWAGGDDRLITSDGLHAQFCDESLTPFITRLTPHSDKPPRFDPWLNYDRTLVGLATPGLDSVPYVTSEFATEYRVSPDCRWVARVELGEVLVTPLTNLAAHPLVLSSEPSVASGLPQFHAPGDGGEYLSWSADDTLHWALGPTLYSWHFGPTGPEGKISHQEIGFTAPQYQPGGVIALTHARIITMRGDEIIEPGTLIINGNRISAIGLADQVTVPGDARVIDLGGRTVIPGYIDVHWHGPQENNGIHPQQSWVQYAELAFGVTTLFDPAPTSEGFFSAAELVKAGITTAPRLFGTGTILYGATSDYTAVINNYEDAAKQIRRRQLLGAIAVKSYLQPRREQNQQIIAAARALGVRVIAEQAMASPKIVAQVADGHTSVEHNPPMINLYDDVIQFWSQAGVDNTPTMNVQLNGVFGVQWWYQQSDVWQHPFLSRYVPPAVLMAESVRRMHIPKEDISAFRTAQSMKRMHDAGVRILVGSHGVREGLGFDWEMWFLAAGGMRPFEVLRAATIQAAEHIGLEHDLGTLERGKLADMVVLDADPIADISNSERVHYVIANGVVFDAATMNALNGSARKPFFWEWGPDPQVTADNWLQ